MLHVRNVPHVRIVFHVRIVAGLATAMMLAVAAYPGIARPAAASRWVGVSGQAGSGGVPTPSGSAKHGPGAPSLPPAGTPGVAGGPSTGPASPGTPAGPGPPAGPGSPAGPVSPPGPDAPGPGDPASRIPRFPAAPPAEKIAIPAGPNAAWLSHIPTTQKVAFLTIDDGWTRRPEAIPLFRAAHVPVTLFLTINAIKSDPAYFKQLQASGAVIEAHTITHTQLKGKPAEFQRGEICGSADRLGDIYGRRPILFRPPFGDQDGTTLQMTHECGMKAAFFWKETVDKGVVRFQEGHTVQPGDIILMHFRPAFVDDFLAALQAIHDAGLTPALLEDYIP
jgi:peptidoglycan/xylan/chitin deacetylase (PgdA/CDA1 family)